MKPEAQLIALLEWLGWTDIKPKQFSYIHGQLYGNHPEYGRSSCPRFTLDLMHEAESKLHAENNPPMKNHGGLVHAYQIAMFDILGCGHAPTMFCYLHATKEQRLKGILKAIRKWVEE